MPFLFSERKTLTLVRYISTVIKRKKRSQKPETLKEKKKKKMYPPTPTVDIRTEFQVRQHLSYVYTRKVVTEVGDLINNDIINVVTGSNENENVLIGNKNISDNVYSSLSSSGGNHSDYNDYLYRHSPALTIVYCVAYFIVFAVGLVGNCLVVAVVFRAPRMRTVTNLFIVNLAIADILVVVLCIPATLLGNIFVRKFTLFHFLFFRIYVNFVVDVRR